MKRAVLKPTFRSRDIAAFLEFPLVSFPSQTRVQARAIRVAHRTSGRHHVEARSASTCTRAKHSQNRGPASR